MTACDINYSNVKPSGPQYCDIPLTAKNQKKNLTESRRNSTMAEKIEMSQVAPDIDEIYMFILTDAFGINSAC